MSFPLKKKNRRKILNENVLLRQQLFAYCVRHKCSSFLVFQVFFSFFFSFLDYLQQKMKISTEKNYKKINKEINKKNSMLIIFKNVV